MGTIDDVRKVIQDLVAPELKASGAKLESFGHESKLRDEALSDKLDSCEREAKLRDEALLERIVALQELMVAKFEGLEREARLRDEVTHVKLEGLGNKAEAQYQSIIYNLNLDKRVESLERERHSASA